jgi:hypothetical protein
LQYIHTWSNGTVLTSGSYPGVIHFESLKKTIHPKFHNKVDNLTLRLPN